MATDGTSRTSEVETLLGSADVLPYRAGYNAEDRQQIERRLQSGQLKGVVSTSALELGIDISHLRVGLNVGVPGTRKAYRQRLGRIGRNGPGAFLVIAPPLAFRGYGTSFNEYHEMSVEPSYLYLDNRFMQFAHGRCLAVEQESLGAPSKTPSKVAWPNGFADMHAAARPGGDRPSEFDAIAAIGGDTPHHGYPLRNVGEINFKIKMQRDSGDSLGEVNQLQALRECYPGGTYLHLAKAYRVAAWYMNTFDPFVLIKPAKPTRRTRPRITTWINTGITSTEVQEGHLSVSEHGFLAECIMQITQRVEGYIDEHTGDFHSYKDLQKKNPNLRARSRNFRTTGVVLCINQEWFKNSKSKIAFINKLRDVFVREYSVAPQDVGSASSNISVRKLDGGGIHSGCVAVFDEIYGSLRLTERLYEDFKHILERFLVAVKADSTEEDTDVDLEAVVTQIRDEAAAFTGTTIQEIVADAPTGYEQVFKPKSRVCYRQAGALAIDVEIIQPTMMNGHLMYQIKMAQKPHHAPAKRWVAATAIEPSADADAWEYAWWNRQTETYEAPPEGSEI